MTNSPPTARPSQSDPKANDRARGVIGLLLGFIVVALLGCAPSTDEIDWRHYSRDRDGTRFSPADQIDASNVAGLRVAWTWSSPDITIETKRRAGPFMGTPLFFDGRVYVVTSFNLVLALDPATGAELWRYDPKAYELGQPVHAGFGQRGLESWTDGEVTRLLHATSTHQLVSLDPATGLPDPAFGVDGVVDMRADVASKRNVRATGLNSPPVVCGDTVVVGSVINDFHNRRRMPAGQARGYDLRTGAHRWTFRTVPLEGEFGVESWEEESWREAGNTNIWAPMTCDEDTGLVYLPVSAATNDHYGGHRPGDNLFAGSLLVLDASTGERKWHYQTVRHGLWDYDLPTAPILATLSVEGRTVDAVLQPTKQGFTWAFDRRTGEPVWPIEEREVPQSDVPGERTSSTQPVPTWPAPFERQGLTEDDLIDFTPELRAAAVAAIAVWRIGPLYTPPPVEGEVVQGLLQLPGTVGGANWGGPALDPATNVLFVPSQTRPSPVAVSPPPPGRGAEVRYRLSTPPFDWGVYLPVTKPPYSRITAIDMNTGDFQWQVANGSGPRNSPLLADLDLPPLGDWPSTGNTSGWSILTPTLLFVAVPSKDVTSAWDKRANGKLRAFDRESGDMVWESPAFDKVTGAPMTFTHQGRQYILLPVQGADRVGEIIAAALPVDPAKEPSSS